MGASCVLIPYPRSKAEIIILQNIKRGGAKAPAERKNLLFRVLNIYIRY